MIPGQKLLYHVTWTVWAPTCCKYHWKWKVGIPNCCNFRWNGSFQPQNAANSKENGLKGRERGRKTERKRRKERDAKLCFLYPWTQQGKKKVYPAVLKQAPKVTPKEGATSAYGCQYPLMLPMPTLTLYSLALEVQAASGCWRHPLSIFQKNARPSLSTLSRKRGYNPVRLSTQVALYVNWFQTKDCWKCHHPTKCLGHPTLKVKKKKAGLIQTRHRDEQEQKSTAQIRLEAHTGDQSMLPRMLGCLQR